MKDQYSTLTLDSLYTKDTYEYTRRTMTPVMACLAELIRHMTMIMIKFINYNNQVDTKV